MLDPHLISVSKIKQAYELNAQEAQSLLDALAPDGVFPFTLWQKAYAALWRASALDAARVWKFEAPPFPETDQLPEKHCPTSTYAKWITDFFLELAKVIHIPELEQGLDYIMEAAYDGKDTEYRQAKENLFHLLTIEDKHIANRTRLSGKKNVSVPVRHSEFLYALFPDTIVVDKAAAVRHLHTCGYALQHEVKGLSRAFVEQITASAPEPAAAAESGAVCVPTALWKGKTHETVRDTLREHNYSEPVIAFILHHWCGLKNKTELGKLLSPVSNQEDTAHRRRANRLLNEAERLSIREA